MQCQLYIFGTTKPVQREEGGKKAVKVVLDSFYRLYVSASAGKRTTDADKLMIFPWMAHVVINTRGESQVRINHSHLSCYYLRCSVHEPVCHEGRHAGVCVFTILGKASAHLGSMDSHRGSVHP